MSAPEEFLLAIGNHLRPQVHSAHDQILREGDEAKAMYWLVRGAVAVISRDGEAVYAELKPGAFFGEIGVLMDMPRTATIVARSKCLLLVLKKEDLQAELPKFPEMEKAIRQEAQERLNILKKKRQERGMASGFSAGSNGAREPAPGEVSTGDMGIIKEGSVVNMKKRKSPSPGINVIEDPAAGSALGSGFVNIRKTLKELPLFSTLPADILHFLGLSAQPKTYPPFTDIVRQGSDGNDIYFIVRGEAEVIHEPPKGKDDPARHRKFYQRPRLRQGQYFGEVASLGLSRGRTATVRAITTVECLMIGGEALDELWRRCPPNIRKQVEETARKRYRKPGEDEDLDMADVKGDGTSATKELSGSSRQSVPHIFTTAPKHSPQNNVNEETMEPGDPDPFLSVDMENLRNRRRNSLAPPVPQTTSTGFPDGAISPTTNGVRSPLSEATSPIKFIMPFVHSPTESEVPLKRARILPHSRRSSMANEPKPILPDSLLAAFMQFLDPVELMRLREVCTHWRNIATTSDKLCKHVNLTPYSKYINDAVLVNILAPFIGTRPESVDISNCFHVTDEGFAALWKSCGGNVRIWHMRSVWDVSASQILEMSEHAKYLEEIDWSNCRKVSDNLLLRVVGWVVPEAPPPTKQAPTATGPGGKPIPPQKLPAHQSQGQDQKAKQEQRPPNMPAPGTVIGCPNLSRLNLSYCKHITDRSMAHLAAHASSRLQSLSLTRCTSITDAGFQAWAPFNFHKLTHLCLADCTYLSDNAIVALVNAAKNLTHLDLSFCCALTDTSTEVVALGLPRLRELRLAFCGSAVSDGSLGCIALHLNDLEGLSVRGCVRVTGAGVENVLDGCASLKWIDASQCRHLEQWVLGGGVSRWGYDERGKNAAVVVSGAGRKEAAAPAVTLPIGAAVRPFGRGFGRARRARKPVRFILEKGAQGLR